MSQDDIDVYNLLSGPKNRLYYQKPSVYFPVITPIEYSEGYVDRFFLRSANDLSSPIIEVDETEFRMFLNNPFYVSAQIRWKITGQINTIIENGIIIDLGISEHNARQIRLVADKLPNLYSKLSDLYQFYKAD